MSESSQLTSTAFSFFLSFFLQFAVSEFLTCPLFQGQSKEQGRNRFPRPGRPCTKPRPHVSSRPDSPPTAPDPAHFPTLRPITDAGLRPRLLSVPRPRPSPLPRPTASAHAWQPRNSRGVTGWKQTFAEQCRDPVLRRQSGKASPAPGTLSRP